MNRVREAPRRGIGAASAEESVDWESAYRDLLPKVYRFFAYRVGDAQIAEDLTSATFERAWKGRRRYDQDLGAFEGWLFGIARNVAADHFRRHRTWLPLDRVASQAADGPLEDLVERNTDFARLSTLLVGLSPREREL
ncbi:MAG TPA: sigma-70 family RNA polymerase sigma factor, partial [Anaerolineales bacterium]